MSPGVAPPHSPTEASLPAALPNRGQAFTPSRTIAGWYVGLSTLPEQEHILPKRPACQIVHHRHTLLPSSLQAGVSFWAAWCIPGVAVFAMTLFFAKLVSNQPGSIHLFFCCQGLIRLKGAPQPDRLRQAGELLFVRLCWYSCWGRIAVLERGALPRVWPSPP